MLELQPEFEVGAGMMPVFKRMAALGSKVFEPGSVTWFPGKVSTKLPTPAPLLCGQSGNCVRRKVTDCPGPANGQTSPKKPFRSATEGTPWLNSVGVFSRRASSEKKKKVLSFAEL